MYCSLLMPTLLDRGLLQNIGMKKVSMYLSMVGRFIEIWLFLAQSLFVYSSSIIQRTSDICKTIQFEHLSHTRGDKKIFASCTLGYQGIKI